MSSIDITEHRSEFAAGLCAVVAVAIGRHRAFAKFVFSKGDKGGGVGRRRASIIRRAIVTRPCRAGHNDLQGGLEGATRSGAPLRREVSRILTVLGKSRASSVSDTCPLGVAACLICGS